MKAKSETRLEIPAAGQIELHFPAPPAAPGKRSTFVAVEGYYRVPIGGALLHPLTILEHRWGAISLSEFAARIPP